MKRDTVLLTTSALLLSLIILGAYVKIPMPWGVPLTLQPLALMLIGLTLPVRHALLTVGSYLLAGFVGLPVFAGGAGGAAYFAGPTGGFLIGFLLMPLATKIVTGGNSNECGPLRLVLACLFGLVPLFACGATWFAYQNGLTFSKTLSVVILPFIPGDLVKAGVATALYLKVKERVPVFAMQPEHSLASSK